MPECEDSMSEVVPVFPSPTPSVRLVPIDRPWVWLSAGWADFRKAPAIGLAYGAAMILVGLVAALCLYAADEIYLLLPITAGFMLVAPALAVGLYDASRRMAAGETPVLRDTLGAWRRNASQIAALGLILMLIHLFWIRIAMLLYPLFFTGGNPELSELPDLLFFSPVSLPFLVVGTLLGGVLAAGVFAISAVSIPMLLDRDVGVITAIATSTTAVRHNIRPLALWAAIIVAFTAFGLVFFYIGLAVTLPLIAHASWHCYKDLVA
jgi:uncharacterized membrane protein